MHSSKHRTKEQIKWKTIEAIIMDIIVAFIGVMVIMVATNLLFGKQIKAAIRYADMISINTKNKLVKDIKFDEENNTIVSYPEYGTRYGNIKIESLDIELPLYYGDKLAYLRYGVGQTSGAYFPGEGGSIICMGHNNKNYLYDLPKIQNSNLIEITTTYGTFTYKVYDTKIINMRDVDSLPIQKEEEILMLYTCYPVNTLGDKKDRFVAFAKRVN
jgi:sortase A